MRITQRICTAIIAAAITLPALAEYPDKPIEVILPWPALATSTDIIARKVLEPMAAKTSASRSRSSIARRRWGRGHQGNGSCAPRRLHRSRA